MINVSLLTVAFNVSNDPPFNVTVLFGATIVNTVSALFLSAIVISVDELFVIVAPSCKSRVNV